MKLFNNWSRYETKFLNLTRYILRLLRLTIYVFWYSCIWLRLIRKLYFSINRCLKFASLGIAKELKRVSTPQGHILFLHWKNALHYGSLILITYMYPIVSKVKAKVTAEKTYFPIYFLCEIGYVSKLPMHTFFAKKDWKFGSVKMHETERNLHIRTRRTFFWRKTSFWKVVVYVVLSIGMVV